VLQNSTDGDGPKNDGATPGQSDTHGVAASLTEALDDLRPGEVWVCGGGAMRCAYWGELLTATARTRNNQIFNSGGRASGGYAI
jgi:hypothetical protein